MKIKALHLIPIVALISLAITTTSTAAPPPKKNTTDYSEMKWILVNQTTQPLDFFFIGSVTLGKVNLGEGTWTGSITPGNTFYGTNTYDFEIQASGEYNAYQILPISLEITEENLTFTNVEPVPSATGEQSMVMANKTYCVAQNFVAPIMNVTVTNGECNSKSKKK